MTDTIECLRADLVAAGRDAEQVQRAGGLASWDEGTYVCEPGDQGVVLRQLGRTEDGDRIEVFATEAEAVAELRRRLLAPGRAIDDTERAAIRERMQERAQQTLAKLEARRD